MACLSLAAPCSDWFSCTNRSPCAKLSGSSSLPSAFILSQAIRRSEAVKRRKWGRVSTPKVLIHRAPAHLKLARFPALTHVLPPNSNFRFCPSMSLAPPRLHSRRYPPWLCLDHSHCPVLVPATLAALPSTHAIPIRDVFYVAFPKRSIRPVGLPVYVAQLPSAPFAEIANDLKRSQV